MYMYGSWVEFRDGYPKKTLMSTFYYKFEDAKRSFIDMPEFHERMGDPNEAQRWRDAAQMIFRVRVPTLAELKNGKEMNDEPPVLMLHVS